MKNIVNWKSADFLLRLAISVILFMHSVPGMFNGGVNSFGNLYLNPLGFGWLGLPLAWAVKLSHVAMIYSLLTNTWIKWFGWITILILITGIILVHSPHGWFVVGGGTNGVEFNFLLIFALLSILYQDNRKQPG
jgi:putative oxidoreductase